MKTLIFNGSPRKNGDTAHLIEQLRTQLPGEVEEIRAYDLQIHGCVDCRYCWKNAGCCVPDAMQEIYAAIREADHIIIASPVYFSELTGALLNLLSRLQMFYAARRFLKKELIPKAKTGGIILCGGGDGSPAKAEGTARTLLKFMNTRSVQTVYALHTDDVPAVQDAKALEQLQQLIAQL